MDADRGAWPLGGGEMADRVRRHDWAATPLGPLDAWPAELRSTAALVLDNAFPSAVICGPGLVTIYNDAIRAILGHRHPEALGRSFAETWREVWTEVGPLVAKAFAGRATFIEDYCIVLEEEAGAPREAFFTFSYSPVRGADGTVLGVINTVIETTGAVKAWKAARSSEARQTFLLELSDRLAPLHDPSAIEREACRLFGQHLRVDRAFFVEIDEAAGVANVLADYVRGGGTSLAGRHRVADFAWLIDDLRRGECHVVSDTPSGPPAAAPEIVGCMATPLVKENRLVGALCVTSRRPRNWADSEVRLLRHVGDRIWAAAERARAEMRLREGEERLAAVFEGLPVGVAVIDAAGVVTASNGEMRRFLPTSVIPSRDGERGWRWRAWRADGSLVAPENYPGARAMRGERVVPGEEMLYLGDDSREIWTRVATVPLHDTAGRVSGHASVVADIDDLKRTAEALSASEERFRSFAENMTDVLWIIDARTRRLEFLSPSFERVFGRSRNEVMAELASWADLVHPDDREQALAAMPRALSGENHQVTYRILRPSDGDVRWIMDTGFPIRNEAGEVRRIGGLAQDITVAHELQERQSILFAELQHRTRNLIGVVRSLAERTAEGSMTLDGFLPRFRDRLRALSRANSLLSGLGRGERVTFDALIRTELEARGALDDEHRRVVLDGPGDVRLRSATIQTFALALHELTTNAVKYGALAAPGGQLSVRWRREIDEAGQPSLHIEWIESGVTDMPDPLAAPRGGGYGRMLIERALPYQLHARVAYAMAPDGVRCTIDLPLR